jgi:hypothetical protein
MRENPNPLISIENLNNEPINHLSSIEIKKFPGCETYSDQEAEEIGKTLLRLAVLLFERPLTNVTTTSVTLNKAA